MAEWKLTTPYGTLLCKKSRSFGEKVWKKPVSAIYKTRYFDDKGKELQRDVYAHVKEEWIPQRGDDEYAKRIYYKQWAKDGKPKKIDGKKVGIVVKKISHKTSKKSSGEATLNWKVDKEVMISKVELKRFVSRDMKYIIPMPESVALYKKIRDKLEAENTIFIVEDVQISKNSSVWYDYAIIPIGKYLVYVEVLDKDLAKPFPPDALIPQEQTGEVGEIEETDEELI